MESMASNSQQFGARNDAIVVRGVHDVRAAEYTKKLDITDASKTHVIL